MVLGFLFKKKKGKTVKKNKFMNKKTPKLKKATRGFPRLPSTLPRGERRPVASPRGEEASAPRREGIHLNKKKSIKAVSKKEKNIKQIGKVIHYFPKVKAGVIKITTRGFAPRREGALCLGDIIYIKGHTTDFKQRVTSMQIEGKPIKIAKKGPLIGLRVKQRVRQNDIVFKEFHPLRKEGRK